MRDGEVDVTSATANDQPVETVPYGTMVWVAGVAPRCVTQPQPMRDTDGVVIHGCLCIAPLVADVDGFNQLVV